jgi:hypothetical protein
MLDVAIFISIIVLLLFAVLIVLIKVWPLVHRVRTHGAAALPPLLAQR